MLYEHINKIALCSNNDKIMQPIDSIETCAYEMGKYLISEKEQIKCNNMITQHKK